MTINYSPSHASGVTVEGTITEDKLFDFNTRTRKVTVKMGSAHLRGELLGKTTVGAVTSAVKSSGANTGTGTFTPDVSTPALARAEPGVYTLRCIVAATNGGTFRLESPSGVVLGDIALPGTSNGTVTVSERIKGVLADGGTDFVVGDGFDITVAAGSNKYVLATAAATDGSAEPDVILLHDVDATAADQEALVAISGDFGIQGVIFGAGITAASADAVLRSKGIFLQNIVG